MDIKLINMNMSQRLYYANFWFPVTAHNLELKRYCHHPMSIYLFKIKECDNKKIRF